MRFDVEETLVRELHQVADGVEVPPLPQLPTEPPARPVWQPLLVAAAVVLILAGAAATVVALTGGDDEIQPAPSPSPTIATDGATEDPGEVEVLSTSPPTVPYVLDNRLFVGGERVPGDDWSFVRGTATGWVAGRSDGTYWWGYDATPQRIEGPMQQPPTVSSSGRYWAALVVDGSGRLTGADTVPGGEGLGSVPVGATNGEGGYTWVAAVTDDGLVITGNGPAILWRPLVDGETVDLAATAPGQLILDNTEAGLLVVDTNSADADGGRNGDVYLASISPEGELTRLGPVPNHDSLIASASWLAWVPAGTFGGESDSLDALQVQRLDGGDPGTLTPPDGWWFGVGGWTWEDDDHLVAPVTRDDGGDERMVRCSPATEQCVLLKRS